MSEPAILQVILETREESKQDVVQVVGVFPRGAQLPPIRDGWTRVVTEVFAGVKMNAPCLRFNPRERGASDA